MKGFLKPPVILPLLTVVLLAGAIIGPLAGNFIRAHAQGTGTVSFTKVATPTVKAGGTIDYTLTLTNTSAPGTLELHDIHLSDLLPPGLTAITAGPTFTISPPTGGGFGSCTATGLTIACTVDNFAPGSVVTITFSASVSTTATGTITNTATAQSRTIGTVTATAKTTIAKPQVLFVLLQGINTRLSDEDVMKNGGLGEIPDFVNEARFGPHGSIHIPGIVPFLKAHGYGKALFLAYSYSASKPSNGHPFPYDCSDTFENSLEIDAVKLSNQIADFLSTQPKGTVTDIYLIGHSLGGAVALTYLTALVKAPQAVSPLVNAHLKGVITLDSPVGGVSGNQDFVNFIFDIFTGNFKFHVLPSCSLLFDKKQMVSVFDLVNIFNTTSKRTHPPTDDGNPGSQGAHASILKAIFRGTALTNQAVMEAAAAMGTAVLTIGNTDDFLYNPGGCTLGHFPTFTTSQWVGDEGPVDAAKEHHSPLTVYGREFTAGLPCGQALDDPINHKEVYNNTDVETALTQFLPNGGEPTALKIAPPEP